MGTYGSYYCKEHQGQDINLTFKYNQDIISFKVTAIISNINKILNERGRYVGDKKKYIHNPGFLLITVFSCLIIIFDLPGINTSFVYFGCMDSVFPYHIEDVNFLR